MKNFVENRSFAKMVKEDGKEKRITNEANRNLTHAFHHHTGKRSRQIYVYAPTKSVLDIEVDYESQRSSIKTVELGSYLECMEYVTSADENPITLT